MKNAIVVIAVALLVVLMYSPTPAQAGDDAVASLSLGTDGGAAAACLQTQLRPKSPYAVQSTVAIYARVSTVPDGGEAASSANVKLAADTLYDLPTTSLQRYICVKPVSNGAGTLNVFLYRGTRE